MRRSKHFNPFCIYVLQKAKLSPEEKFSSGIVGGFAAAKEKKESKSKKGGKR